MEDHSDCFAYYKPLSPDIDRALAVARTAAELRAIDWDPRDADGAARLFGHLQANLEAVCSRHAGPRRRAKIMYIPLESFGEFLSALLG